MVGQEALIWLAIFNLEVLIWLANTILRFGFANTVFHKTAMIQLFYAEYAESVLDILSYPELTMGHYGWARRKIF